MAKGLVYILTNPCLDGWVKIGMTELNGIERRLQELNAPTNMPLSFRCYAVYEVENPLEVETRIHSLIDRVDDSFHAQERLDNGRIRRREFFKMSPETAFGIFKDIAALRGDSCNLQLYTPTEEESQEQELAERRTRRSNNSFKLLQIDTGEEIKFLYDDTIIAKVIDEKNKIEYGGITYTISDLARKILIERFGWADNLHVNGWTKFTKDGVALSDLRNNIESMDKEDE